MFLQRGMGHRALAGKIPKIIPSSCGPLKQIDKASPISDFMKTYKLIVKTDYLHM